MKDLLRDQAIDILEANDRGGYTVPTARLYPYQWNWDSVFTALGFAVFDRARAWRELDMLFQAQWADGMVPHIIFRKNDPDYFPGPGIWQSNTDIPTSGHSQPPVAASAILTMVETGGADDETRARVFFPKLMAWHRWWHEMRDPDGTGVVGIIHPWESGRDNCPDWDSGMALIKVPDDLGPYHRRDTDHVNPQERPTVEQYDRYLSILKFGRECRWNHVKIARDGPFFMADPGCQFTLLRGDRDLLTLAKRFGETDAIAELEGWIERSVAGSEALWNEKAGGFVAKELRTGALSGAITNASMLALYSGAATDAQAAKMLRHAREIMDAVEFGFPSWDPRMNGFEARRYWRGPVWSVMNYMIAIGLEENDQADLAARIRSDTLRMVEQSGFYEYFDPLTGDGLGGPHFSWTAAIHLAETKGAEGAKPAEVA
jgi:glycogen debranching enzyme